jgi:hypothetical protein
LKWREAFHKDLKEVHSRGVWKKVNKEEMLHGDLKEEIFMEIPGMEASKDEYLLLKKTIYELVHGARQFYLKLVEALKGYSFAS